MPNLGFSLTSTAIAAPDTSGQDPARAFIIGPMASGPTAVTPITSSAQFQSLFGADSDVANDVNVAFNEGLKVASVVRLVGPAATAASASLKDASGAETLTFTAKELGDGPNSDYLVVTDTGIELHNASGAVVESQPGTTKAAQVAAPWSNLSVVSASTTAGPAASQAVTATSVAATTATTGTLAAGTYTYAVSAVSAYGESLAAATVTETTNATNNAVVLTITGSSNEFNIYRRLSSSTAWLQVATSSTATFTDTGVAGTAATLPAADTSNDAELSGGNPDTAGITPATYGAAVSALSKEDGIGSIVAPRVTDSDTISAIIAAAGGLDYMHTVIYDLGNGSESQLASAVQSDPNGLALPVAGFIQAPTPTGGLVSVSAALVAAAKFAISDVGSIGNLPAGPDYPLTFASGTDTDLNDVDRQSLYNAGGNTFHRVGGQTTLWGGITNAGSSSVYQQFTASRVRMYIAGQWFLSVAPKYIFKTADGQGILYGAAASDLEVPLQALYASNALFGDSAAAAFAVVVGVGAAASELAAQITLRYSEYVSYETLNLVAVPTTQSI